MRAILDPRFTRRERQVGERVAALLAAANPTLGIYAKADGIHLRLTAKAQSRQQAEEMIARGEASVSSIMAEYIWGTDDDTLEAVVGQMLMERRLSLAAMESYSGGLLAATITQAPAATAYFRGGLIAPSDEAQIAYGVDAGLIAQYGAASAAVVGAMAETAKLRLRADIGVGITGSDEPAGIERSPFSTIYIGIDDGSNKKVITDSFPGNRDRLKRRVVTTALFQLRNMLLALD